jgi:DNA-binding transcriptional LysR family regulator
MELTQLRCLVHTVRLGGVGEAARALHVSQPAVSAQLRRLHEQVGEPLFERRGRRLVPTELARQLVVHAEDILRRVDALEESIRGLQSLEHGRLALGTIDAASVYVLPEIYREFHHRHPGVRVEIRVDDTTHLLEALRAGDIELATATLPVSAPDLSARAIYREPLVPVVHRSFPLAGKRRITLEQISEHGVISYPAGSRTRRLIEGVFAESGVAYRATMEVSSPEAMKRLAQAELGVCILPRPVVAVELRSGALIELSMGRVRFEREIGMVYRDRDTLSPPARVFLEMVEKRVARARRSARRTAPKSGR